MAGETRGKMPTVELAAYIHPERRKNNPEVGIVHAEGDPDAPPTRYAYDLHIDPALQFDVGRAAVERLIDDALASGEPETMRAALAELKRAQAPYLNWASKAERTSFAIDTVSLHVHERIDPATILAGVRKTIAAGPGGVAESVQPWLFDAPFEALPLRQALDFYAHDKGWANRLIAGDSLLVMNSLLQKESLAGQVQMIYFDPPYGIKYGSNFQPFTGKRDVKDGADADLTQEPEMLKAFRDTWELGIHSYLTYLRDRLKLMREILATSGSIFLQISRQNIHHARELMDEVFGAGNFISIINYRTTSSQTAAFIPSTGDYLLWYARDAADVKFRRVFLAKEDETGQYRYCRFANGEVVAVDDANVNTGRPFRISDMTSQSGSESTAFSPVVEGILYSVSKGGWKTNAVGLTRLVKANRISPGGRSLSYIRFRDDFSCSPLDDTWNDTRISGFSDPKRYVVQTAPKVIERCIQMTTEPGDLVFDPTCGSGTTATVAEEWGRRWITCDTSRVAVTLAKQRLMTAGFDYYRLRDPLSGLKGGFVCKAVPHVMLKSIANNSEIDAIYERLHPTIETALAALNASLVD